MKLTVKKREVFWKSLAAQRKEWNIPWIVYSKHLEESIPVFFDKLEFLRLFEQSGYSSPISLEGDWIKELVLIYDISVHPVTDRLVHVDFHAVKADEKTEAEIPVLLEWDAPIEKQSEWKVELVKDTVLVEALPNDLPHDIKIDVSNLASVHDVIFVKDINLSDKVEIKDDLELPIVTVVEIKDEPEEDELESSDEEVSTESEE